MAWLENCPKCGSSLVRAYGKLVSDMGSTDVFNEQGMVCINPKCPNYCGPYLSKPLIIVETRRTKEN